MKRHAVVAIINIDCKILIGKKRKDSLKFLAGEWHIPGETVEDDETDEAALIRGMREETGLEIKVGRYLGSHITPTSQKEARWYECFALDGELKHGSDLEDINLVEKNQVLRLCSPRATSFWPEEIQNYFQEKTEN
jgi:8-oxo-dGTP pyrophosphatase MutT (NUDIX family)